ncbi:hypothetical protein ACEZCY_04350 [Streptacidiphilus sp. N1-12]|uniref:Protein translocase subunit SecA n=2 Tax=Streptacidiphilus alkalitolerans TaxID=3342712 RepID=A0ABV6V457_9ACTN
MMAAEGWWRRGGGSREGRTFKRCSEVLHAANALEDAMQARSDEGLRDFSDELRRRHTAGTDLSVLLPEAAALVREGARRVLGQRLDDAQVLGGAALQFGAMVEMRTGEGKTLAVVLSAYLGALTGEGVHVMTANDYLAERDATAMGPLYRALGLACGLIVSGGAKESTPRSRRAAYAADVTYGTPSEMAYDYLRDNRAWDPDGVVQRGRRLAIVDEGDLILIDEARENPMIRRSGRKPDPLYGSLTTLVGRLRSGRHYTVDTDRRTVVLTDAGTERVEDLLGVGDLYRTADAQLLRVLDAVLKAKEVYRRDRDYLVTDTGAIEVITRRTGRPMTRGSFPGGLTQAIAAKEGVVVPADGHYLGEVTMHRFLRGYQRLSAIGGVATETRAYQDIYGLEVVRIPLGRPLRRVDQPPRVYPTASARLSAAIDETAVRSAAGQPVLLGTVSIAQTEEVSAALTAKGVAHRSLSAKNHAEEADVIAKAGRAGAVTVVTRMVGRGVDIPLGGGDPAEREAVVRSGGLHVLALDVFGARRDELQMRGRAGRRGDPGGSAVFTSLEDESLDRLFGHKNQWALAKFALDPSDTTRAVAYAFERALNGRTEQDVERLCSKVRYDDVLGEQCDQIYRQRKAVFDVRDHSAWMRAAVDGVVARETAAYPAAGGDSLRLHRALADIYPISLTPTELDDLRYDGLLTRLQADAQRAYDEREAELSPEVMRVFEHRCILWAYNKIWGEYLDASEDLMADTNLSTLTGGDPLAHFRNEAARRFATLPGLIERESVHHAFHQEVIVERDDTPRP